jgi:hypothetical protein
MHACSTVRPSASALHLPWKRADFLADQIGMVCEHGAVNQTDDDLRAALR